MVPWMASNTNEVLPRINTVIMQEIRKDNNYLGWRKNKEPKEDNHHHNHFIDAFS